MVHALSANLVHFCRYLRARGLDVVPATGAELLKTAELIGFENVDDVPAAFRAMTISRPEHRPIFDDAFDLFFGRGWKQARPQIVAPPEQMSMKVPVLGADPPSADDDPRRVLITPVTGSW